MTYRFAILASHPIQYQAPLFRKLAEHPEIDLVVYYGCDYGIADRAQPGIGKAMVWDIPLLEGYPYKFLKNSGMGELASGFWWQANWDIREELREGHYDALLIYHLYSVATSWIAWFWGQAMGVPLLYRGDVFINPEASKTKEYLKKLLLLRPFFNGMSAFLTVSTWSKDYYLDYGIPEEKMFLTPYSIDNDRFVNSSKAWEPKQAKIKQEEGFQPDLPVILYLSNLIPEKRPLDLIQAFQKLKTPATLVFIGPGDMQPQLEAYVRDNQIDRVHFLGFRNQGELPKFYAMADIFVMPSTHNPWITVVNEAMCGGLPVVASDAIGAAADLVYDGENGYKYEMGNVDELAMRLDELAADPTQRKRMGDRSREIMSTWNYDANVEAILDALAYVTEK